MHESFWNTKIEGKILCDRCKKPISSNNSVKGVEIRFSFGDRGGAARHAFCGACARKHCGELALLCGEVFDEMLKVSKGRETADATD